MAQINQDLNAVEARAPMEVLPAGKYPVIITQSDVAPTKKGDGSYLSLEMTIFEGQYKGRKVWERLNLWNPSAQAVEIAQRTLRAITDAIGHPPVVQDSNSLHDKPFVVSVKVVTQQGYEPKNEPSGYFPWGTENAAPFVQARPQTMAAPSAPVAQPPQVAAPSASPAQTAVVPPWKRKG